MLTALCGLLGCVWLCLLSPCKPASGFWSVAEARRSSHMPFETYPRRAKGWGSVHQRFRFEKTREAF